MCAGNSRSCEWSIQPHHKPFEQRSTHTEQVCFSLYIYRHLYIKHSMHVHHHKAHLHGSCTTLCSKAIVQVPGMIITQSSTVPNPWHVTKAPSKVIYTTVAKKSYCAHTHKGVLKGINVDLYFLEKCTHQNCDSYMPSPL